MREHKKKFSKRNFFEISFLLSLSSTLELVGYKESVLSFLLFVGFVDQLLVKNKLCLLKLRLLFLQ